MNTSPRKFAAIGLMMGVASALCVAVSAHAGSTADSAVRQHESVVVQYGDLNLNSGIGIKSLYSRLENAADKVCGRKPDVKELRMTMQYRACYQGALDRAVDKIGNRNLHGLHQAGTTSRRVG